VPRKKPYQKKTFESAGAKSDISANIYMSMLISAAWRELTPKQQVLYLYCKAQYYAEKKKPNGDPLYFTMNQSKWRGMYGLYKTNDEKSFYRDMSALISRGFVVCIESGKNTRTKSVYAFSDKWRVFGTSAFEILPNEMTTSMLKELRIKES